MEEICSSEKMVDFQRATLRYIITTLWERQILHITVSFNDKAWKMKVENHGSACLESCSRDGSLALGSWRSLCQRARGHGYCPEACHTELSPSSSHARCCKKAGAEQSGRTRPHPPVNHHPNRSEWEAEDHAFPKHTLRHFAYITYGKGKAVPLLHYSSTMTWRNIGG